MDIGNNLKRLRENRKMTQRQLAEHIGYTEKSVSKWENNDGLPSLDVIIRICDLFQIPLEELIYKRTSKQYLLGIDGGGTRTTAAVSDENGNVLLKPYFV